MAASALLQCGSSRGSIECMWDIKSAGCQIDGPSRPNLGPRRCDRSLTAFFNGCTGNVGESRARRRTPLKRGTTASWAPPRASSAPHMLRWWVVCPPPGQARPDQSSPALSSSKPLQQQLHRPAAAPFRCLLNKQSRQLLQGTSADGLPPACRLQIWCQAVGALFVGMLSELVYASILGLLGGLAYGEGQQQAAAAALAGAAAALVGAAVQPAAASCADTRSSRAVGSSCGCECVLLMLLVVCSLLQASAQATSRPSGAASPC
jgi:hypothetical protein